MLAAAMVGLADSTWLGGSGSWGNGGKWSGDVPDEGIHGYFEGAVFDKPGGNDVALDADRGIMQLVVRETATEGVTLSGGAADATLHLGGNINWGTGLFVDEGAGPLVIGSPKPGNAVNIFVSPNKYICNQSANAVVFHNLISGAQGTGWPYDSYPGLTFRGRFHFAGNVDFDGAIRFGDDAPGVWDDYPTIITAGRDAALGTGTVEIARATALHVEDFPRAFANGFAQLREADDWSFTGDAPVTITPAGGDAYKFASWNWWNTHILKIRNTAPVALNGRILYNNPIPAAYRIDMGAGTRLAVNGGLYETGYNESDGVLGVVFTGFNADIAFSGVHDSAHGVAPAAFFIEGTQGFNTVSLDGADDIATAFGSGDIRIDCRTNETYYFKALKNGLILPNRILATRGYCFLVGFTGENDLTLSSGVALRTDEGGGRIDNLSTATLTIGGALSNETQYANFNFTGSGTTHIAPGTPLFIKNNSWGGPEFLKYGSGTFIHSGTTVPDIVTGATRFIGGKVILDYASANDNKLVAGTSTVTFELGGADIVLKGGDFVQGIDFNKGLEGVEHGGTRFQSGANRIRRDGGSSVLELGDITAWGGGGTLDCEPGAVTITSENPGDVIPYITTDSSNFAMRDGANVIRAFTNYRDFAHMWDNNRQVLLSGNETLVGGVGVNNLKIDTSAGGGTLTVDEHFHIGQGGLLVVGDNDYTITGGTEMRGSGGWAGQLFIHHFGAGTLTLATPLCSEWDGVRLVLGGTGRVVLANPANSYSARAGYPFGTYINGGTLVVPADDCLGADDVGGGTVYRSNVELNGGALEIPAGFATQRALHINHNGGTIEVAGGATLVCNSPVTGPGALVKSGAGTLALNAAGPLTGAFVLDDGAFR
ncbi:MAG: hypothetical protein FWG44_05750, partial [Oscillospiraceae bacterium]|nr:hypothetical protein [Oscillospiraceae bacterium]